MKTYQSYLLIISLFFCTFSLIAQQKEIAISIGDNHGYFKDSNYSPLNYQQQGMAFGLDYTRYSKADQYLFNVHLDFSPNTLHSNAAEHFSSDYLMGTVAIDFLKKSSSFQNRAKLYLGGRVETNNHLISYDNLESFTYMFNHSVSFKGLYTISKRTKHSLHTSIAVPLFNYMVRPPLNGFDKTTEANEEYPLRLLTTDGKITSLNTFLAVDWAIQYRYTMNQNFDVAIGYNLQYQRHKDIHHLTRLENQFVISAIWKMGDKKTF